MAEENAIGGESYVTMGGISLTLGTGTHTISLMSFERTGVPAAKGGAGGYTKTGRVPFIEIEGLPDAATNPDDLQGFTNGTVVSELANGRTATLNNAWFAGTLDVDASAGTYSARFEGKSGNWT